MKPLAGVVKMVSSPAMVPRIPSALPSESSRRAIELRRARAGMNHDNCIVVVDIQHQIFQWTGGGWYTQFSWQAVNHFHFGIACTYSTKLGQHPRDFRLINIVKALLLQRGDDFALELNFSSLSNALNALTSSSCLAELRISHPIWWLIQHYCAYR